MLIKEGETRASVYYLPGQKPAELPLSFLEGFDTGSHDLRGDSHDLKENSHDLRGDSHDLRKKLDAILAFLGLEKVPGKMQRNAMRELIMQLCDDSFVKLRDLSKLLNRGQTFIQQHYISGMLSEGLLELKYPHNKNHHNIHNPYGISFS